MVGAAVGSTGGVTAGLAAASKWIVPFMKERRLKLVTEKCLEAKEKSEREYYHSVLRTSLNQSEEPQLDIEATTRTPRQRTPHKKFAANDIKPKAAKSAASAKGAT
jgi:hypothetical protein